MRPAYLTEFHTLPTIQAGHSSRPQWTVLYLIDHLLGLYLRRTRCGTPTGNGNGKYNFIKEIDIFDFVCFLLVVSHKGILITFAEVSLPVGQLRIVCKSR